MAVIGVDVDGVLASFEHGYVPLLTEESGLKFPDMGKPDWPPEWDYDIAALKAGGFSEDQRTAIIRKCWSRIKGSQTFWLDLPPHAGAVAFLQWLSHQQEDSIYFITNRPGRSSKWQTERWLKRYGYLSVPTVLVSAEKGNICRALAIDFYIDDKWENCIDVIEKSPKTHLFMLTRPYNRLGVLPCSEGDLSRFKQLLEELEV